MPVSRLMYACTSAPVTTPGFPAPSPSGYTDDLDIGVIGPQLGLDFGEVPGERGAAITRAYVRAFFDRHLRGEPQPLLDGPSASYPEVSRVEPSS